MARVEAENFRFVFGKNSLAFVLKMLKREGEELEQAGGLAAISRWLSAATPPVIEHPDTASRRDASTARQQFSMEQYRLKGGTPNY